MVASEPDLAAAAALLAEPARAELVLATLADGPLTASELASRAGIARSTASGHLRRLVAGGLLVVAERGRHRHDDLAGRLGVELARALERRGVIARRNGDYVLGDRAVRELAILGIDLEPLSAQRRPLVRGCLDWSERELHVAGALGAALN